MALDETMQAALAIATRIWDGPARSIMVSLTKDGYKRRHVRLYRDDGGLYVRLGRRAVRKQYLKDMQGARVVDTELAIVVFHEFN